MCKLDETNNNLTVKKEKLSSEELEKRILVLEKELERIRSNFLDKMIDIAEQELKIDIRKSLEPNNQRSKAQALQL